MVKYLFKNKTKYIFVLIFFILTAGVLLFKLCEIEPFYSFSLRANDLYFKLNTRAVNEKVVLVVVDEKSVNRFGRWPWDRKIFAKGLSRLSQARVVILDIVFSEETDPQSDTFLAQTIENMGNVVCGFFVRLKSTQKIPEEIIDIMSDSALFRVPDILPFEVAKYVEPNILPVTESCALVGIFNAKADKDNIFRHYPLGFIYEGDFYPSIGIQGLRIALNQEARITEKGEFFIGDTKLPIDSTHMVPLNFYSYEAYKPHMISFADVFDGKVPSSFFKDKIVVVGISEAGVTDIRATPIGQIPGPLLHLTFISNFLNGELLKSSKFFDAFLILLTAFSVAIIFRVVESPYLRAIGYFLLIVILIGGGIFFYKFFSFKLDIFFPGLNIILLGLAVETYTSLLKSQQARFLKSAFGTYLSDKLLQVIIKDPDCLKLGGEKKEITVLFSDIRGFTSMSEKLAPEVLVEVLNLYLTPMTELILKNEGTLDKYIGDAIMALWNAPLDVENHPQKALITAYEMLEKLKEINTLFQNRFGFQINIGVGINTGPVVVGNMGSEKRFDYTAIGDTVNLASRLEGLNKVYKTNILFSEFTYEKVNFKGLPFIPVDLDLVRVKGKLKPVKIFTLLSATKENMEIKKVYEEALVFYRKGNFVKAQKLFSSLKFPPAQVMGERCKELLEHPPEEWDGVFVAKTK